MVLTVMGACATYVAAFQRPAGLISLAPCSSHRNARSVGLPSKGTLHRTARVCLKATQEPERGEEDSKSDDDAWKMAKSYDSGVRKGSFEDVPTPMYTREERVRDAEDWLKGRSLFDKSSGAREPRDAIRQQEWDSVNLFANENSYKAGFVGILLLFAFYVSVYNSGGIDGSQRVYEGAEEGCVLEGTERGMTALTTSSHEGRAPSCSTTVHRLSLRLPLLLRTEKSKPAAAGPSELTGVLGLPALMTEQRSGPAPVSYAASEVHKLSPIS
eukprot:766731-Hanusia_phi.AAC.2